MKKYLLLFSVLVSTYTSFAQDSGITYQAVIYKPGGEQLPGQNNMSAPLANANICLQFSIIDVDKNTAYQEVVKTKTDDFGMVNLVIGTHGQSSGYAAGFSGVAWDNLNNNLRIAIDVKGGCSQFEQISNQPLNYVPMALYARKAESILGIVPIENGGTGTNTTATAKANLGLELVDNTTDLNKPVSTATQTALDTKVAISDQAFTGAVGATGPQGPIGNDGAIGATGPQGPIGNGGTGSTTQNFVDLTANQTIAGSKTFTGTVSGIDKTMVGLANVDNTTDALKPVSTATKSALDLKEVLSNKSIDVATDGASDVKYPSVKSVKTYVDAAATAGTPDATTSAKGKIQLAGDLAGTSALPTITNAAVIGKVLTGFSSAAGTVVGTDTVLEGFGKIDGNVASKANLASPTFTGTPTLPTGTIGVTQTPGNNTTALATTAYADAAAKASACGLSIGDTYQGGIIFYLDPSGCHGLISAPSDQSAGIQWFNGSSTNTTAFSSCVGCGDGNTSMIVYNQGAGSYAAKICYDLSLGGKNDWYLPSKYELKLMYENIGRGNALGLGNVGGFASAYYWSSNELDNYNAWAQSFDSGFQFDYGKLNTEYVRAVRAF